MKKIRVLVADSHPVFREGLRLLCVKEKDIDCVATAQSGEEAVKLTKELLPDVVLIDIATPLIDGIKATKQIKADCPTTAVVILSHCKSDHCVLDSLQAGVAGYLSKDTPISDLTSTIRLVHGGNGVFNLEAAGTILHNLGAIKHDRVKGLGELHKRELEILKLVAKGMSNKEIGYKLGISDHTVGTHLVNIFRKLEANSRTEAVLYGLNQGWFTMDDLD